MNTEDMTSEFEDFCRRTVNGDARERSIRGPVDTIRVLVRYFKLPPTSPTVDVLEHVLNRRLKYILKFLPHETPRLVAGSVTNNTYNMTISALRKWCMFWKLDLDTREYRQLFKRRPSQSRKVKTKDELLTTEDIEAIVRLHRLPMYRAFTAVLWDTGCRPSELLQMDYDDVERDEHGFVLHIKESKTERRSLRLITAVGRQNFQFYYVTHVGKGPLFIDSKNKRLGKQEYATVYKYAGTRLKKKIYPTLFRKSASTYWKLSGLLDDTAIRRRLGHRPDSKVFEQHYQQYYDSDYEEAELRAMGVRSEKEATKEIRCWNCGTSTLVTAVYCPNCNQPIDRTALAQQGTAENRIQVLEKSLKETQQRLERAISLLEKIQTKE